MAATTTKRLGQTRGAAEVGRELGDAGGPLLIGALAATTILTPALLILAPSSAPPQPSSPHPSPGAPGIKPAKGPTLIGPTQSPRRHRVSRTRTFPSCLRCRDSRPTDVTFRDHNQPAHSADAAAVEHSVFRFRMGLRESRFGARPLAKLVGDIQTPKRPMAAGAVPVSLLVGSEPEKRD